MADPYVRQARGKFVATIGSTGVTAGDMMYFDGTDWELADADDNSKFAEAIAINSYDSGENGVLCTDGIIVDTDAPYTQGSAYYLSETAGAVTATRPTTENSLTQVVGFGVSTSELRAEISPPRELSMWVPLPIAVGSAALTAPNGDWGGISMTANADAVHGMGLFPNNCVSFVAAFMWHYNEDTLATGGVTVDVSAGKSSDTGTTATDGITDTGLTVATGSDIGKLTVSGAFDAAGIVEAGNHFTVDIAKASETGGDDFRVNGVEVVVLVV
jgi:hypothetical protein